MNLQDVNQSLEELFQKPLDNGKKRHIVFWYDENGEFVEEIDHLLLKNIRIWKLSNDNLFATKYELEKNDPTSHFLIYANMAKPSAREDWLLDVYQYSLEFATDKVTMIMRDLGVTDDGLRPVFNKYLKFFNNKERYALFKAYNLERYTEEAIDIAILSALCKNQLANLDEAVKTLFRALGHEHQKSWDNIQKFGDEDVFWYLMEKYYGYTLQKRSLQELFTFFLLTTVAATLEVEVPKTWNQHISQRPTNCIVLMTQFMNDKHDRLIFNELATQVEETLNIAANVERWDMKAYLKTDCFPIFDEKIMTFIVSQLQNDIHQYDLYLEMIAERRRLHWFVEFCHEYEALKQAIFLLKKAYELDFYMSEQNAYEMYQAYCNDYSQIDTAYRKFYAAYDKLHRKERLQPIQEKIENVYTNWFLDELAIKWSAALENKADKAWPIAGLHQQNQFYQTFVQPYVNKGERVFVIISDALRFEAAQELCTLLNKERKGAAELTGLQGVLPSYTDLGMAVLLPHQEIFYEKGQVVVDGIKAASTENRHSILQKSVSDSLAIQYRDIYARNRQQLRDLVSGKKLIYIYHNAIDARGDHAVTEWEVFNAVEDTFAEIRTLINHLTNSVSASNIIITADHGFIYQRERLQASDKINKPFDESATIEKRRFVITEKERELEGTIQFSLDYLLGDNAGKFVAVPRGTNRFAVQGAGANYVHGGAMLQEIVVPVITFKNDRSKSGKNEVRKVDVKLTSITRKITNMITYLSFFQTEKVEVKKQPLRLKIYFSDREGNRISNETIIIADSESANPENRTYKEKFVLKDIVYDKTKTYYLILAEDNETTNAIYDKIPYTIDLA